MEGIHIDPVNRDHVMRMDSQDVRIKLQNFLKNVHSKPAKVQARDGVKYVPVSAIEDRLDKLFFGLWEIRNFHYQVVGNEIIGDLELTVVHPTTGMPLTRTGAGAVPIRLSKGSKPNELQNKISTALTMDFPHLKSECLKNAAKSLGKSFGRDLNRDFQDIEFTPLLKDHSGDEEYARVRRFIAKAMSTEELEMAEMYKDTLPEDDILRSEYAEKFKTLTTVK